MKKNKTKIFFAFISPWLIGFVFLTLGPMLFSLFLSFTDWDMLSKINFVGLDNYITLFTKDPDFYNSLTATFYWLLFLPIGMILSLFFAVLLNQNIRGKVFFRTALYIPVIVPVVVNCLLWLWLYNPEFGLFNIILGRLGLDKVNWLLSESTVMISLIIMSLWQLGGNVVIFLAALQGVSKDTLEAADIDGAGRFRKFFHIVIPEISPTILFQLIMGIVGGMQVFAPAQLMTGGGPNKKTYFIVYQIYEEAFVNFHIGYASSISWILFLIIAILVLLTFKFTKKHVFYNN